MAPRPDEEVGPVPAGEAAREFGLGPAGEEIHPRPRPWQARGLSAAKFALAAGSAGVLFLCLSGLKPAALAIPLFLASISLLLGAASAALFAWVAYLQMEDGDPGSDDDGGGPGGGWDDPSEPPGGGDLELDWQRFERDFRSYCERVVPTVA